MYDYVHWHCSFDYNLLCVPERTGTRESAAISKNVSTVLTILFLI